MSKRTRIHPVQFYLNDDEQYILEEKYRLSRMKSKSAFLRKMILYGFVYEVDYSHIRKMNTLLGNISSNLNQITHRINSTNTVFPSVHNKLIDTNAPNIAGNIGLQKWANKENLKIVSAEYNKMFTHNLHNFSELEDRIALLHMQQKEVNTSVVSLESQIRHLREMLKYAEQYQKNKIYDDHYKSSKDPDRYFRKYESQIILFAGAEHILQENGMDLKHLNSNKLQEQIADLISRKESLNTQYVSFKQEIKELELIHQNLSKYLKQDAPEIQRSSHNQLPSL